MTWEQTRLTQLEEAAALTDAGIDTDMSTWSDFTLDLASRVLDEAQAAKVARLTLHKAPAAYTLADMAEDLGAYYDKTEDTHAH